MDLYLNNPLKSKIQKANYALHELLVGRTITSINHYQGFHVIMDHKKAIAGQPPNLRLQMYSDWKLNSEEWWQKFVSSFPVDTQKMAVPYEPVRAFAVYLLADSIIESVRLLDDHTLAITFSGNYILSIPGNSYFSEESWVVDAYEDERFKELRISSNSEGELELRT